MVSAQQTKQQDRRTFSQLDEADADFMIGQDSHEAQTGSKTNLVYKGSSSNKMRAPI